MIALRTVLLAPLAVAAALVPAADARAAGDPIMPLAEVAPGMQCTALSVFRGTEPSPFGAEVLDVVAGDATSGQPRILLRLHGPAIEPTGVGPGFSGSPVYCAGRVIGAISESVGEYGGLVALATPIEAILGQPVDPPAPVGPAPAGARRLATPISIAGVSTRVGRLFRRAAARGGRVLQALPGRPRAAAFPPQVMRPGASMAAGLASGDITGGAVGTVAYVDGDRVWAFGHPLDGAGRRSLLLQDAYVYTVVSNPIGTEESGTYKLASPGHDLGAITSDGLSAVAGRTGVLPDRIPLQVFARDQDTGRLQVLNVSVADESALGLPTGTSALSLIGSTVVAQAASTVLGSTPARQTGEMCMRIEVRQRRRPLRFCNRYVTRGGIDDGEMGVTGPMVTDFLEATTAVDEYNFDLDITSVEVNIKVRRGLRQAFLLDARGPDVVRRGGTARVRVRVREVRAEPRWRTFRVRVPRGMPRGERVLVLEGTPADTAADLELDLGALLFGAEDGEGEEGFDEAGPRTIGALARAVARIGRYDGVLARFLPPGGDSSFEELGELPGGAEGVAQRGRRVVRDPELRLSGEVRIPVFVR